MQRYWDKYGLQTLLAIVGSIILWGILFAPGRPDTPKKKANIGVRK